MSSTKCGNCGLINFKSEAVCKRCKAALGESSPDSSARAWSAAGSTLPPQYERVNEQASDDGGGVWQDRKKVVKHVGALLPNRCLKCNSTAGVAQKVYTLKYYPAYNIVLFLFGFTRYLKVDVEVGICAAHRAKRTQRALLGTVGLLASVGLFILGLEWNMPEMWIGSFIMFIVSCVFLACFNTPVSVAKIKEPYVWLTGADEQYLSSLPQWSGGGYTPLY